MKTGRNLEMQMQGERGEEGDILEGIRRAATTLQHNALLQSYGHMLEDPERLRPDVLESLINAQNVSSAAGCAASCTIMPMQSLPLISDSSVLQFDVSLKMRCLFG